MSDGATVLTDLKALLRDALRVGPDVVMEDDMPLIGGPIDLDSIDILLIVSTIEKRFEMKIPSEALGRSAFESVRTLAKYVEDNRKTLGVKAVGTEGAVEEMGGDTAKRSIDGAEALARLPHGAEFRFVSMVRELVEGEGAVGVWIVEGTEGFLKGHFPGRPLVPGVLLTEALAQVAGLAAGRVGEAAVLSHVDVKFLAPVVPPAGIELRAEVIREGSEAGGVLTVAIRRCEVMASVGGMAVAKGVITLHFQALKLNA